MVGVGVCIFVMAMYKISHSFQFNKFSQDDIQTEVDAKSNAKKSLDEISKEVNDMKVDMMKNNDQGLDTVSDGDGGNNSQRAALGEIDKIKKIVEILETVVVPTIVDSQNAQKAAQGKASATGTASVSSDPIKIFPNRLRYLQQQHHAAAGATLDDGNPLD